MVMIKKVFITEGLAKCKALRFAKHTHRTRYTTDEIRQSGIPTRDELDKWWEENEMDK